MDLLINLEDTPYNFTKLIIIKLLKIQQEDGWWRDTDNLINVPNLPFYQDPEDASVKIFNTSYLASLFATILNIDNLSDVDNLNSSNPEDTFSLSKVNLG